MTRQPTRQPPTMFADEGPDLDDIPVEPVTDDDIENATNLYLNELLDADKNFDDIRAAGSDRVNKPAVLRSLADKLDKEAKNATL